MFRLTVYISLVIFTLVIVSCGNSQSENNKPESSSNNEQALKKAEIKHIDAAFFQSKIFDYRVNKTWKYQDSIPCIIDFYADWCGPCKTIAPILEDLSREYAGKIKVYKVNVDKEQELASVFNVNGIPALLFCPVGRDPQMATGALPKSEFEKVINEFLLIKK